MITRRRVLLAMTAFLLLLRGAAWAKTSSQRPACKSVASCNELGTQAFEKGDIAAAIHLFKQQVGYAEDARDKKESEVAYNNLALAYIHNRDYLRALAWTDLALQANSESEAARHNLAEIQKALAKYRWPTDVGGTYVQYAGRAQWNSLCISRTADGGLKFRLLAYRMGAAWRRYGPAAYGDVKGEATLATNGKAQYSGDADFPSCHIEMKFTSNGVTLEQQGDCGFGYGVHVGGRYERINPSDGPNCDEHNLP
jgi:tetratricopeptide (TPR) repeat protein